MAAVEAAAQVHPPAALGQTFLASLGRARLGIVRVNQMFAHSHVRDPKHRFAAISAAALAACRVNVDSVLIGE
ncbi:hypothetical protein GCM10023096_04030 [Nonomuraea ferruginea]